jgi:hypothetical protein
MENKIPEKFMNGDGTLNADALIKSYAELEKKIGGMISVPTGDADAEARAKFNRAIGVPADASEYPTHDLFDDDSIRSKFLDANFTKSQVEKIYSIAEEFISPMLAELFQSNHVSNSIAELEKFFGGADKMTEALAAINSFGEKFLPADAFETLCSTPQGIQSVWRMMRSSEPDVATEKNASGNLSDTELRRMMRDPKYWRDHDAEYVRKIESGFKKLYS